MAKKNSKPTRIEMEPEFDKDGHQTVQSMIYGRIDPAYLNRLLLEHRAEYRAAYDKAVTDGAPNPSEIALRDAPVKEHLGRIIQLVVTKTICNEYWHGYTPDWKEDMEAYAIENMLLYCHNYDPEKMKERSKNGKCDPYYYLANATTWAFVAVRDKKRKQAARMKFTSLNDNLLSTCTSLDQYAGVVKEDTEKKKNAVAAAVGDADANIAMTALDVAFPDNKHDPDNVDSPEYGKDRVDLDQVLTELTEPTEN